MASNKGQTYRPDPLTPEEVREMLESCSRISWTGRRAAAVIATLWRTGMRRRELVDLEYHNYRRTTEERAAAIRIMHPKGAAAGKPPRLVAVDRILSPYIDRFIDSQPSESTGCGKKLFTTQNGGAMHVTQVYRIVRDAATRAGLADGHRIHPHGLRHTFAADLVTEGVNMHHIQKALGHTRLATTEVYLRSIGHEDTVSLLAERR